MALSSFGWLQTLFSALFCWSSRNKFLYFIRNFTCFFCTILGFLPLLETSKRFWDVCFYFRVSSTRSWRLWLHRVCAAWTLILPWESRSLELSSSAAECRLFLIPFPLLSEAMAWVWASYRSFRVYSNTWVHAGSCLAGTSGKALSCSNSGGTKPPS